MSTSVKSAPQINPIYRDRHIYILTEILDFIEVDKTTLLKTDEQNSYVIDLVRNEVHIKILPEDDKIVTNIVSIDDFLRWAINYELLESMLYKVGFIEYNNSYLIAQDKDYLLMYYRKDMTLYNYKVDKTDNNIIGLFDYILSTEDLRLLKMITPHTTKYILNII